MKQIYLIILLMGLIQPVFSQTDKTGSKDHPLVQRFKQSYIYDYEVTSFEPYTIVTGKSDGSKFTSVEEIEGKIYRIFYSLSTDAGSVYEVYINYLNALKNSGAEIIFNCKNVGDCGKYFWDFLGDVDSKMQMPAYYGEELAYIAAKFNKNGKGYYVSIIPGYGLGEIGYEVTVVEVEEMEQQINLEGVEKALSDNGKVAFYGILFETGSDKVQQNAYNEIELIARYLNKNSSVSIYIVGHTDNTGSFSLNQDLSARRANAVKEILISKYGVNKDRLIAVGVGPVCPESVNTTAEGRMKNRRVEIVLNQN